MIRRVRQTLAGLMALVVVATILVGVPVALIELVGWPLPTQWPTMVEVKRFVDNGGIADSTVIKVLAVVVWLAWIQIAAAIIAETLAAVRRQVPRRLPLAPGLQPLAAKLVATIALLAATTTPPRLALAVPLDAAVAAAPSIEIPDLDSTPLDVRATATDRAAALTKVVVATARDSWWSLAEAHLGDGLRWREVRDLNIGRTVGDGVAVGEDTERPEPGWRLVVPTSSNAAVEEGSASAAEQREWHVQDGDHFWGIAEQTLTDAWDRPPTDTEIAPYWQQLVEANRDQLLPPGDPDLIYPDQRFAIPPTPDDPTAGHDNVAAIEPTEPDAPDVQLQEPPAPPSPPEPQPAPPDEDPPAAHDVDVADRGADAAASDQWKTAIEQRAGDDVDATDEAPRADGEDEPTTALGLPVGLAAGAAAAAMLASGVTATIRWRRRAALQRRAPGFRLPTPLPDTPDQLATLEAATLPEATLDDVASLLTSIPPDAHPVLVMVADDSTVTLLFDERDAVVEPPAPWVLVDDGSGGPIGWEATVGSPGPERSVGLPLLATLGRKGTSNVMANLGGMRTLAVTGPEDEVRRHLRSVSLEVATSRVAVPVEVTVAGDDRLASLDHVRHIDDVAAEIDAALREQSEGVVHEDRTPRLLVCHHGVAFPAVPDELVGHVGLVHASDHPTDGWHLAVDRDGTAVLRLPDGGTVDLTLPAVDPVLVDDELSTLDHGAVIPDEQASAEPIAVGEPSSNGHRPAATLDATAKAWCEVRLLGPAEVVRGHERMEDLTLRTMEMLAYLATHRDGVSKERLDDALWAGRAAGPGSQRVTSALTRLRRIMGEGPGGELLVPRRAGAEPIRLSDHVGCDLDRAFAHLAVARDLPGELRIEELAAALELVRGQPFEDLPVSWASDITQRAIIQLQDAALEVARARREAGDFEGAEAAVRQGLLLLDPADALYLERAEIEKARGHPERVAQVWKALRRRHAEDADEIAGTVSSPTPEIELAFRELIGSHAS